MPVLTDMDSHQIKGSNFGFSAKRIDDLGATEYTLVGIAADVSGSVESFRQEIESCIKEIVKSCQHSPRADNLMMRLVTFDDRLEEVHGFRPLSECNLDSYNGCVRCGGMTALYDGACNLTDSVTQYGRTLTESDFDVNAIVFIVTDGMDNRSAMTVGEVKKALGRAVQSESLESIVSVLVGVNVQDPAVSRYLTDLKDQAGFTQYVEIGSANAKSLARLADFVSRSISSQSQALGTGGASKSLSF